MTWKNTQKSNCCNAPLETHGDTTKYYVCTLCNKACDERIHGWIGTEQDPLDHWEYQCSDGIHNSFWKTIVSSPQWERWCKVAYERGWDTDECTETGWCSPNHLSSFFDFIVNNSINDKE